MIRKAGDPVEPGEVIAQTDPFFKFLRTTVKSDISGVIESVSPLTGQVLLRHPPNPVEVNAYVDGKVVEVIPGEGVVIETEGAFVQGIFGVGGEASGPIVLVSDDPSETVSPDRIGAEHADSVLLCGALASMGLVKRAIEVGAAALIAGGINADDLKSILGYDLGVAITGTEDIGTTIIVTEGFGEIPIARRTFDVISGCSGQIASVNGATQIRAGVLRPEIISVAAGSAVPAADSAATSEDGMAVGDRVRVIREPDFGMLGQVVALPPDLQQVESETMVRVLEIEFDDGSRRVAPRANVESITE